MMKMKKLAVLVMGIGMSIGVATNAFARPSPEQCELQLKPACEAGNQKACVEYNLWCLE
ncbi:hypothetical protein KIH87_07010 [Paraneptunicella aestuarii]|uniref:hypothetical protein n=1 Tax=Paraneptunicella aestuarii TaxID=2831148 RepID=UPI001E4C5EDB|nr:hypothetical protein [Paraneptunicella aestuarii]UAA40092.1 hypothetical protein KIH87_07010 [Paraneptunicella aestuarii]